MRVCVCVLVFVGGWYECVCVGVREKERESGGPLTHLISWRGGGGGGVRVVTVLHATCYGSGG